MTAQRAAGLAYRAAGNSAGHVALLVHGYPQSSFMWRHVLPALADAGWRALAPDLPGYGNSKLDPPATWERHVDALQRFVGALGLGPIALITHDWGALIALRWACERQPPLSAVVVSNNGGFFPDRDYHALAQAMRTPGKGERLIRSYTREGFGEALRGWSPAMTDEAIDEYWKAFADDERRLGQVELYRSAQFERLSPYRGCLARLSVPALILWGRRDASVDAQVARRFQAELPDSELTIIEEAGHFVWDDAPRVTAAALVDFLDRRVRKEAGQPSPRR